MNGHWQFWLLLIGFILTLRADVCWFSGNGTDRRMAREAAISEIARRNREWVNIFEAAGAASGAIAAPRR